MIVDMPSWIGLTVDDFVIDDLLSDGPFFCVYRGVNSQGEAKAFKLAKARALSESISQPISSTKAFALAVGHVREFIPDAADLLQKQVQRMQVLDEPEYVYVEHLTSNENLCYSRMELIVGQTLREMMNIGPVPIQIFIDIANDLHQLQQLENFKYHGNLSPENILISSHGIKLISPGYWGPLESQNGLIPTCAVTTPAYYPDLTPDDLYAMGLIIWEAALGQRPLGVAADCETMDHTRVGNELLQYVRNYERVGKFFMGPILEIYTPSQLHIEMPAALENFLLEAIGLRLMPNGKLDKDTGFSNFHAMASALTALVDRGITHLAADSFP